MKNRGQALITLLFFTAIAINVTAAAVVIIMLNSLSGAKLQQGSITYEIAQSGIENAKIRLLRDPDYTGENSLTIGSGVVDITVSKSGAEYTILSEATVGNFKRKLQVDGTLTDSVFDFDLQEEVF